MIKDKICLNFISRNLEKLEPRERRILQMIFGINEKETQIQEVAKEFGVTYPRIEQLAFRALEKINFWYYFERRGSHSKVSMNLIKKLWRIYGK